MTCIVAVKNTETKKIYMGCDSSLIENNWIQLQLKYPKIIKFNDMLIGISGTLRPLQLIQYQLVLADRTEKQSNMQYLCSVFAPTVKQLLVDNDCIENKDNYKQSDSNLLIGYRSEIYIMDSNFQIIETKDNYAAIGSGQDIALGSLGILTKFNSFWKSENMIRRTLEIVDKHHIGVCKPFRIMSV